MKRRRQPARKPPKPQLQLPFTRTVEDVFPEVWDQECTFHCAAFAIAQFMTILYRVWKPAEYKDLIISPQQVINEHARTYELLLPLLTRPKGLYSMARQPYLRVRDTTDKLDAERYGVKSLKLYQGTAKIENQLVINFHGGPGFPVYATCHMFGLTNKQACRTTPQNPYVRVCRLKRHQDSQYHSVVVITGIHITEENRVSVQIKNSWGEWGVNGKGHTWVTAAFITGIYVPKM